MTLAVAIAIGGPKTLVRGSALRVQALGGSRSIWCDHRKYVRRVVYSRVGASVCVP